MQGVSGQQQEQTCQDEAISREQQLAGDVAGLDLEQGISSLDGRIGASPQEAA